MGKKGDLLRAQKAQTSTYTFTREQLKAHDMAVVEDYKKGLTSVSGRSSKRKRTE